MKAGNISSLTLFSEVPNQKALNRKTMEQTILKELELLDLAMLLIKIEIELLKDHGTTNGNANSLRTL
jgi:hypothetical protein